MVPRSLYARAMKSKVRWDTRLVDSTCMMLETRASLLGVQGRWMYHGDFLELFPEVMNTGRNRVVYMLLRFKPSEPRRISETFGVKLTHQKIVGTFIPRMRHSHLALHDVLPALSKDIIAQAVTEIKFSMGSLGFTIARWPLDELHLEFSIIEILDYQLWVSSTSQMSTIEESEPEIEVRQVIGHVGGDISWILVMFRDPSPLTDIVTRSEVIQLVAEKRRR